MLVEYWSHASDAAFLEAADLPYLISLFGGYNPAILGGVAFSEASTIAKTRWEEAGMSEEPKPIFEIDLGSNGGKCAFYTLDDIEAWFKREETFWSWLSPEGRNSPAIRDAAQSINQALDPIKDAVETARSQGTPVPQSQMDIVLNTLNNSLEHHYRGRTPGVLHSSTPQAKYVDKLREESPRIAAFTAAFFTGHEFETQFRESLLGAIEGHLFNRGAKGSAAAEKKALQQVRDDWQERLNAFNRDEKALLDETRGLVKGEKEALEKRQQEHQVMLQRHDKTFKVEVEKSKETLKKFTDAYGAHMALQAPVTYWISREKHHHDKAGRFWWYTIGFGGTGALAIYLGATRLVPSTTVSLKELSAVGTIGLGLSALVWFWLLRILVRNLLSHLHLETDAGERVVMAKTYIALLAEGKGPKDEDRNLVLQALFRPAATGIVKDEGLPPSIAEFLTRFGALK